MRIAELIATVVVIDLTSSMPFLDEALESPGVSLRVVRPANAEQVRQALVVKRAPSGGARLALIVAASKSDPGLALLEEFRHEPLCANLPCVVLIAQRDDELVGECVRLGANSIVLVPTEADERSEAISSILTYWLQLNRS